MHPRNRSTPPPHFSKSQVYGTMGDVYILEFARIRCSFQKMDVGKVKNTGIFKEIDAQINTMLERAGAKRGKKEIFFSDTLLFFAAGRGIMGRRGHCEASPNSGYLSKGDFQ